MRLLQLFEARKKTNRRQVRQQLAHTYRGPGGADLDPQQFAANAPWKHKVNVIFREMDVPQPDRRRIMDSFKVLERTKGPEYMQLLTVKALTDVVHRLVKGYAMQHSRPVAHQRPGVSGIYNSSYGFPSHMRMTPDRELRHATLGYELETKSGRELALHPDPKVRRIATALHPGSNNQAVVYDLNDIPYYILIHPYKKAPGSAPKGEDGVTEFTANIPHGILPSDTNFALYNKKQITIEKLMKTHSGMEVLASKKEKDFQKVIVYFQELAWEKSRKWFEAYTYYRKAEKVRDELELRDQRQGGLTYEEEMALKKAHIAVDFYHDIIMGKVPKGHFADKQVADHIKEVSQNSKKAYKWYVWLLISEAEYGIRLPERARMYPNFPTTPSAIKGLPYNWSIQPKRENQGKFDWDVDVIRGLGYRGGDWQDFEEALKASSYRFIRGEGEIQQLWLPLVGNVREKFGLKLHPQNISDYISSAHHGGGAFSTAKYVVGKTSNKLTVRKVIQAPLYVFQAGTQKRQFALIPAANYHQHFDSPHHGGERLIHGEAKLQSPVSGLALSKGKKWGDRLKNRAQAYRGVRGVYRGTDRRRDQFAPRDPEQERLVRDAAMAAQNIEFARKALLQKNATQQRIAARQQNPAWAGPDKTKTGHKQGMWVATKNTGRKKYVVKPVPNKDLERRMYKFGGFATKPQDRRLGARDRPTTKKATTKVRFLRGGELDYFTFPEKQSRS
jgi:hypothetical protein